MIVRNGEVFMSTLQSPGPTVFSQALASSPSHSQESPIRGIECLSQLLESPTSAVAPTTFALPIGTEHQSFAHVQSGNVKNLLCQKVFRGFFANAAWCVENKSV